MAKAEAQEAHQQICLAMLAPLATLWLRDADLSLPPRRSRRPPPLFHRGRLFVQGVGLRAVDAYNGRTLWEFSPKESLQPYNADKTGSNFCVSDQGLYVRLGGKCLRKVLPTKFIFYVT